jgi:sugar lactone lactonase YvrE
VIIIFYNFMRRVSEKTHAGLRYLAAAAGLAAAPVPAFALDLVDLNQPESVVADPQTGTSYISNVNGAPADKDANGYISKMSADGLVVVIKFIESKPGAELHAPKGMAIVDGTLFVADIDAVKGFRVETGERTHLIDFSGFQAQFLNDVASDGDGNLYVSDMLANRIYKVAFGSSPEVSLFREGAELGQPNGLFFDRSSGSLLVATWGSGEILRIAREGELQVLRKGLEGLDGIAADRKGNLFVSSYPKGEIYIIGAWGGGALSLFRSGLTTPADIFFDAAKQTLFVPLMNDGKVTSFAVRESDLPSPAPAPRGTSPQEKKSRHRKDG